MLHVNPAGLFSSRFTVARDGTDMASLSFRAFRDAGSVAMADQRFTVRRQGSRQWRLERADGAVVAAAEKPSAWRSQIIVRTPDHRRILHLRRPSTWRRTIEVLEAERKVGEIRQPSSWRRRVQADLPDDLPEPIGLFGVWLVLMLFRREDHAASGGST